METFIKLIINISLLFKSGCPRQRTLFDVEEMIIERIKKGVSSSESLAGKLTGRKAPFQ